jgi:hypothetical protein
MANTAQNVGIKNSWSLISFARAHGKMKVAPFVNRETGEPFKSCAFVNSEGVTTLVAFSSNLGELTPQQIATQKDSLQVVELESGTFKLCKPGNSSWEDVDLGL